ncbi:type IV pilus biogenesis protein PilM [Chromobacterium haemolyticum]|uniref:type IV pilus biogenesis protein PilM n=1 Tax=Chromobacterium haemolyticum TaxID=394935 RepID=UPI002448BAB1|nr:type IV pilus biogenesis protein PilM [Chromobacterium haemolyticum]MDH0342155.1 type IV pilus biogenesis protein PilM [Chromobacterium haemolyticum]
MQLYPFFFAISIFITSLLSQNLHTVEVNTQAGEAQAVSGNMEVYRNNVVNYARNNPGVTGTVADSALGLPTWFNRINGVSNYVMTGKGYVFYSAAQPQMAYMILKDTNNSIYAGIKKNGVLFNPINGVTTISLPSAIPDGSVVYGDG